MWHTQIVSRTILTIVHVSIDQTCTRSIMIKQTLILPGIEIPVFTVENEEISHSHAVICTKFDTCHFQIFFRKRGNLLIGEENFHLCFTLANQYWCIIVQCKNALDSSKFVFLETGLVWFMVSNAIFNNISVISRWSVLLAEGKNSYQV